jgi:hypothetical protein
MIVTDLTIKEVKAKAVVAPLKRPIRTAVGTIPATSGERDRRPA